MIQTLLNTDLVNALLAERGITKKWLIGRLELNYTQGYLMLREGFLPANEDTRSRVIAELAQFFSVSEDDLLVRFNNKTKQYEVPQSGGKSA